jgi:hypothetical protein
VLNIDESNRPHYVAGRVVGKAKPKRTCYDAVSWRFGPVSLRSTTWTGCDTGPKSRLQRSTKPPASPSACSESGVIEQSPGADTRLEIEAKSPTVRHVVTVGQVQRWV